jgi:hypothetical protein
MQMKENKLPKLIHPMVLALHESIKKEEVQSHEQ